MTKDTPDSLSLESYGNFDTQVKLEKLAEGHNPTPGSLAVKVERLVLM